MCPWPAQIDISEASAEVPAGLTFAPGSMSPGVSNLYVVDRRNDNVNDGTLYEMSFPPTSLPIITIYSPRSGATGVQVTLTGSNFNGANNVSFNGSSAGFTIISGGQIRATVPSGATTGRISVRNGSGTSFSFGKFTVTGSGGTPQKFTYLRDPKGFLQTLRTAVNRVQSPAKQTA